MPLAPKDIYHLEKEMWTDADFDNMGWHDVLVHALAFDTAQHELLFDLDYLFAWVDPAPPSEYYSFWLSPATLVFHNAWGLKMHYDASLGFQLQSCERSEPRPPAHPLLQGPKEERRWTLQGNEGEISFWASGYTQFTRHEPRHHENQSFNLAERGGISFDRPK